jgi:hypothetical protein
MHRQDAPFFFKLAALWFTKLQAGMNAASPRILHSAFRFDLANTVARNFCSLLRCHLSLLGCAGQHRDRAERRRVADRVIVDIFATNPADKDLILIERAFGAGGDDRGVVALHDHR